MHPWKTLSWTQSLVHHRQTSWKICVHLLFPTPIPQPTATCCVSHDITETTLGNIINYLLTSKTKQSWVLLTAWSVASSLWLFWQFSPGTFSSMDLHKTPTLFVFLLLNLWGCKLFFSPSIFSLCVEIPQFCLHFISNTNTFIINTVLEISWFYFHLLINATFLFGAQIAILIFTPECCLFHSWLYMSHRHRVRSWEVVRAFSLYSDTWVWILAPPPWVLYLWAFISLHLHFLTSPALSECSHKHTHILFLFLRKTWLMQIQTCYHTNILSQVIFHNFHVGRWPLLC